MVWRNRLSALDPTNASFYMGNASIFRTQLQAETPRVASSAACHGKRFIAYHRFFEYLANEFGFSLIGCIKKRNREFLHLRAIMQQLMDLSRQAKPDAILTTAYHGRQQTDALSSRTGLTVNHGAPRGRINCASDGLSLALHGRSLCLPCVRCRGHGCPESTFLSLPWLCCPHFDSCLLWHARVERGIIFVDLSLAQFVALGSAVGLLIRPYGSRPIPYFTRFRAPWGIHPLLFTANCKICQHRGLYRCSLHLYSKD